MSINNKKNRVHRSLEGNTGVDLICINLENAALIGIMDLDRLWQQIDEEQQKKILENDNLAELLRSIIYHDTDHNLDMDVFKWFNQHIDNSQRKVIYSKIFRDIIKFFISKNYVEGLNFIKQGMDDIWNDEFTRRYNSDFLPVIMLLENPKMILSWVKLNVSNSEIVQSIDHVIEVLNKIPEMEKRAEELKEKRSRDINKITNSIGVINNDPTKENLSNFIQIINTVNIADLESDEQILKEYQKTIRTFTDKYNIDFHNNLYIYKIANAENSIINALAKYSEFTHKYKHRFSKLIDPFKQLSALLDTKKDVKAKLDEVINDTEGYSVAQANKAVEYCIQEMEKISKTFSDIKAIIPRNLELNRVFTSLGVPFSKILEETFKGILQLRSSISFVDKLNENFKLNKDEYIKLNIDLMSIYPKLAKDLDKQSPLELLQLKNLVGEEYTSTIKKLHLMQSMLSDLRLRLSEKPIVDQQYRDFTEKIIKKLELQLKTFDKIKLKFNDVTKFTTAGQIAQNRGDFIAKIRALKQNLKFINKQDLLKEAIKNDSFDIVKSLIEKGTVLDAEMKAFAKEHGSAEMSRLIKWESSKQGASLTVKQVLDLFDGCSSLSRRKKRQPCDLERAWENIKDFLQEEVVLISESQDQLTEREFFVRRVYDNINSVADYLRQGFVVDLEIAIDQYKRLSAFAKETSIRHNDLQEEDKRDIANIQRSISRIKTSAEIYHNNQNDFDLTFNSVEQGLAKLSQKIEDFRTKIGFLESSINNFESLISRVEPALPVFREAKLISIRMDSRRELLSQNYIREQIYADHQQDVARIQQIRERINGIQDLPQGVKSFLENEIEEVSQKAVQISGCLQLGGRRKRETCSFIEEEIISIDRLKKKVTNLLGQFTDELIPIYDELEKKITSVREKSFGNPEKYVNELKDFILEVQVKYEEQNRQLKNMQEKINNYVVRTGEAGDNPGEVLNELNQKIQEYINLNNSPSPRMVRANALIKEIEPAIPYIKDLKKNHKELAQIFESIKGTYDAEEINKRIQEIQGKIHKIEQSIDNADLVEWINEKLEKKVEKIKEGTAKLSGCLGQGMRRKRATGSNCDIILEDFGSMISRKINEIDSDLVQLQNIVI